MSERTVAQMAAKALSELAVVFDATTDAALQTLCDEVLAAGRIACYGVGREGLMMRALCMRLMHLGLDAHVVGDVTTPPVGAGDVLIASAGPGVFSTVLALLEVARGAGARTVVVTAQPFGEAPRTADGVVVLPAQTMADDSHGGAGILPMGSLYEAAQLLFFDLASIRLRELTRQAPDEMRARHTNLE
jgi:6-phospho-3-hexuloisomerase